MEDPKQTSAEYLDQRTPESEERRINRESRSAEAVGTPDQREGTAPLSSTNPGPGKKGGDVQHVANTGLPPGVDEGDLWDPGSKSRQRGEGPAENRS